MSTPIPILSLLPNESADVLTTKINTPESLYRQTLTSEDEEPSEGSGITASEDESPEVTAGISIYEDKAGGHSDLFTIDNDKKILKPIHPQELMVYEKLKSASYLDGFIPKYYGTCKCDRKLKIRRSQKKGKFLVLENLTKGFKKPCVMDLKLGNKNYRDNMKANKIAKRKIKYSATTAASSGFRISGLKVYQPARDAYAIRKFIRRNRLISDQDLTLLNTLSLFLFNGMKYRLDLVPLFLEKIQSLIDMLSKCTEFDFIASSVLLIYEGDITISEENPSVDIRLIDFDHTIIYSNTTDVADESGIRIGLTSLMEYFRKIYNWNSKPSTYNCLGSDNSDDVDYPVRRYSTSQVGSRIPSYLHEVKYSAE